MTTPCTYNRVGEINADLRRMVYTQSGDSTLFSVHSDDAPTVYVNGTSAQPIRDQTDPLVRNLEREMSQLSWLNPYTGVVENNIMVALADHIGMKTLHMVTADPFRTGRIKASPGTTAIFRTRSPQPGSVTSARVSTLLGLIAQPGQITPMCARQSWNSWD